MPRNRGRQGERPTERKHNQQQAQEQQTQKDQVQDSPRPADFNKIGPLSIDGVEVSDLPDKGRGDNFTNFGKESSRNLPQNTGEYGDRSDTGLRGDPQAAEADKSGGRKKD